MPVISTTDLGPFFSQSGVQQPQGGGTGKDAFVVNVNDLGPAMNPSETILQMGGGYVGAPTNVMAVNSGYGGAGIQSINAPNITILDRVQIWVNQNPILTMIGGIGILLYLSPGDRGRGRR